MAGRSGPLSVKPRANFSPQLEKGPLRYGQGNPRCSNGAMWPEFRLCVLRVLMSRFRFGDFQDQRISIRQLRRDFQSIPGFV